MGIHVRKWGNSAAVRLPAAAMAAARISIDDPVEVREEDGRIVIERARSGGADLRVLVAGINDDNRHDATDWGAPQGNEIW